jgi:hypothetical protein
VGTALHAEVFVKMKFKRGALTIVPAEMLGAFSDPKPVMLQRWDDALAASGQP